MLKNILKPLITLNQPHLLARHQLSLLRLNSHSVSNQYSQLHHNRYFSTINNEEKKEQPVVQQEKVEQQTQPQQPAVTPDKVEEPVQPVQQQSSEQQQTQTQSPEEQKIVPKPPRLYKQEDLYDPVNKDKLKFDPTTQMALIYRGPLLNPGYKYFTYLLRFYLLQTSLWTFWTAITLSEAIFYVGPLSYLLYRINDKRTIRVQQLVQAVYLNEDGHSVKVQTLDGKTETFEITQLREPKGEELAELKKLMYRRARKLKKETYDNADFKYQVFFAEDATNQNKIGQYLVPKSNRTSEFNDVLKAVVQGKPIRTQ
eukprot:403365617